MYKLGISYISVGKIHIFKPLSQNAIFKFSNLQIFKLAFRYRVVVFLCSLATLTYLDRICISIVGVRLKQDLRSDKY